MDIETLEYVKKSIQDSRSNANCVSEIEQGYDDGLGGVILFLAVLIAGEKKKLKPGGEV